VSSVDNKHLPLPTLVSIWKLFVIYVNIIVINVIFKQDPHLP